MKPGTVILFSICFLVWASSSAQALGSGAITDISQTGIGARAISLGNAYTALADEPNAIFVNPAGIGKLTHWQFSSMNTSLLGSISVSMVSGVYPTAYGTFGVGYIGADTPAGFTTSRDSNNQIVISGDPLSFSSRVVTLSYSNDFNNEIYTTRLGCLTGGVSLKLFQQNFSGSPLNGSSGFGYDMDLGFLYTPNTWSQWAVSAQNILPTSWSHFQCSDGTRESIPFKLKVGSAYRPRPDLRISLDGTFSMVQAHTIQVGAEWAVSPFVALRAGLNQAPSILPDGREGNVIHVTTGLGMKWAGLSIDYAYRMDGNLSEASTHFISFGVGEFLNPRNKDAFEKIHGTSDWAVSDF